LDPLWAPWRRAFLEQPTVGECIFCQISRRQSDAEDYVLYRGETVFLSLNKYPYNVGHTMIVPYRHMVGIEELNEDESAETFKVLRLSISATKAVLKPDGFNIGANIGKPAGAGIEHFHIHTVPRWLGDTNFMPILTDTKVLSDSLEKVWRDLSEEIKRQSEVGSP